VVQLSRLADGRRRVMSVSEITGMEGSIITMQDIFIFRKKGRGENGEVLGDFIPTASARAAPSSSCAAWLDPAPSCGALSHGPFLRRRRIYLFYIGVAVGSSCVTA
jgi:pilus assembly protein CpaF